MANLDRLRQRTQDARAKRDEIGWKLGKARNASRPDLDLIAHLERDYMKARNRWIDLEQELERLQREQK